MTFKDFNPLKLADLVNRLARILSVLGVIALTLFFTVGSEWHDPFFLTVAFIALFASISLIFKRITEPFNLRVFIIDLFLFLYYQITFFLTIFRNKDLLYPIVDSTKFPESLLIVVLFLFFVRELSQIKINYKRIGLSPAQLFLVSFVILIFLGGFLIWFVEFNNNQLKLIDAFFMSTSAVCVTGLSVVEIQTLSHPGKIIILLLIQLGGLGIMTFAMYFSFLFKNTSSYENRMIFLKMSNANHLNGVFQYLKIVIGITLIVECLGVIALYYIPYEQKPGLFKSIFHGISAFNNAGFSLYNDGLVNPIVQNNYPFQLIICFLVIVGGLGFPIIQNIISLIGHQIKLFYAKLFTRKRPYYKPWIINMNTKIILVTSGLLLFFGTAFFFIFEYDGVLKDLDFCGKLVHSFTGAVFPRTAGFNSWNMSSMGTPTIILIIILMWIGASPASTGGGIKTTTFFIATATAFSLGRSKERIEFNKRKVSVVTIKRALAIIFLSLAIISIFTVAIIFLEEHISSKDIFFEVISAISTAGLSLGITKDLSDSSKVLLMILMFIGRVGSLTLLIAIFKKYINKGYKYPTEEVLIN